MPEQWTRLDAKCIHLCHRRARLDAQWTRQQQSAWHPVMNHLNMRSPRISLELPAAQCDMGRRETATDAAVRETEDELRAARGILIALGLSACMWLIVLTAVVFF
jgi:hypothetical protein